MFAGFLKDQLHVNGVDIAYRIGGTGPGLLLLHGHPQTHVIWHKVAEQLAEHFTVVAADLRGYGDSGRPPADEQHNNYSKREMARDGVELMKSLLRHGDDDRDVINNREEQTAAEHERDIERR